MVTPCSLIDGVSTGPVVFVIWVEEYSAQKMQEVCSFERLVSVYQNTWHYIRKTLGYGHHCETC